MSDEELLAALRHYEKVRERIKTLPATPLRSLTCNQSTLALYAAREARDAERVVTDELHRRGGEATLVGRRLVLTDNGMHFYEPTTPAKTKAARRTRQTPRRRVEATL